MASKPASNKRQKPTPGGEVERLVKQCSSVLKALQRAPAAIAFLAPVDWKTLKLPTYPKMIKHPMDLGTVEQKLSAGRYATVSDFTNDVNQIWENAHIFNQEGSDIYDAATQLRLDFEQRMRSVPDGPLREGSASAGGRSSSAGGSSTLAGEELAQCKKIVGELRKKNDAEAFLEPVDWKALGIPDYPNVIKRPMDLGTVAHQLDAGHYTSVRQVANDVELVWNNAMTYNMDGSWIHQAAAKLKIVADGKFSPLLGASRQGVGETVEQPTELTFEMKHQLNQNANLLTSKDLYGMVGIVEEHCKKALDQTNPAEVEIDIDTLDLQTFLKVDKYVQDCLARAKRKKQ
eukprot:CAMPEP_0119314896 /NCGR_PEP_ID=MMETSP1333-20130426/34085_1 /TAXON_ID=418940 /ORGANISM="Scyphosphaera apsteinii, Strain RCC1455" /LENGTH=345 /DNA_ID=CAMNT_0007320097 /DNA_START=91 /DNA_END=1128 /DNA_ORIENTATION=+